MRPRLTDEQKAAIAEDIRATAGTPEGSYRKIATRHDVGLATVQKVAKDHGLADAWQTGHEQTKAATEVRTASAAAKRAQLENDLLDDAQALRAKLFGDVVHLNVVKVDMGTEEVRQTVLEAGPADWRATMAAIGTASSKSVELARFAAEQANTGQASGLLRDFMTSLRARRAERDKRRAEADDG